MESKLTVRIHIPDEKNDKLRSIRINQLYEILNTKEKELAESKDKIAS